MLPKNLFGKRLWFLNNAAPIPGVSSLKKRKRLRRKKLYSFQTFQSWLQVYNKKQTKTFFGMQKNQNLWNTFCTMESLYQSTYRKSLFTLNAYERNAYAYTEERTKNGKFLKKLRTITNSGDFYTIQNLPS